MPRRFTRRGGVARSDPPWENGESLLTVSRGALNSCHRDADRAPWQQISNLETDKEYCRPGYLFGVEVVDQFFAGSGGSNHNTDVRGDQRYWANVTAGGKNSLKAALKAPPGPGQVPIGTGLNGLQFYPGYLGRTQQETLLAALRQVLDSAPLYTPRMPKSGRPFTVRMSNCGPLGWTSDESGYRYTPAHPQTGRLWPPVPDTLVAMWNDVAQYAHPPEACLINFYAPAAKMGLHQDRDEGDFTAPVVSLSLGDTCLFRVGGLKRGDSTRSFRLNSGDVVVLGGGARLAFHGVDRIYPGTSTLLTEGGRINLTLRRVTRPE
jgi:alkylated DNA repair protein (DNA oxidative demethylase)